MRDVTEFNDRARDAELARALLGGIEHERQRQAGEKRLADQAAGYEQQLAALREEVAVVARRAETLVAEIREQVREVREQARRDLMSALWQWQCLLQALHREAPAPVLNVPREAIRVQVEQSPAAVTVNVPPEAIHVRVEQPARKKVFTYHADGRPAEVVEQSVPEVPNGGETDA
jgi:hypothetical protein